MESPKESRDQRPTKEVCLPFLNPVNDIWHMIPVQTNPPGTIAGPDADHLHAGIPHVLRPSFRNDANRYDISGPRLLQWNRISEKFVANRIISQEITGRLHAKRLKLLHGLRTDPAASVDSV